jgi:hypothetical protein
MLKLGEKLLRTNRHRSCQASRERKAHGEQEAMEILKEGLAACGLMEKELKAPPGSDVRKVAIAVKIWENTTMSMSWISENLEMKSAANARQQILARSAPLRPAPAATLPDLHFSLRTSRKVLLRHIIQFDRLDDEISPTERKSVTLIFHPNRKLWVTKSPPFGLPCSVISPSNSTG